MLILTTAVAIRDAIAAKHVALPIDALERYAALLDTGPIAWLFILQTGDTAAVLEKLRGRAFSTFEFIDRADDWFEAVFVLSDDGFGHVVLVPDRTGIDQTILDLCRAGAA